MWESRPSITENGVSIAAGRRSTSPTVRGRCARFPSPVGIARIGATPVVGSCSLRFPQGVISTAPSGAGIGDDGESRRTRPCQRHSRCWRSGKLRSWQSLVGAFCTSTGTAASTASSAFFIATTWRIFNSHASLSRRGQQHGVVGGRTEIAEGACRACANAPFVCCTARARSTGDCRAKLDHTGCPRCDDRDRA